MYQIEKHTRGGIVAILRNFSKVALVHAFIKEAVIDLGYRGSSRYGLCRELQTTWLMHHSIDCQVCNHRRLPLNVEARNIASPSCYIQIVDERRRHDKAGIYESCMSC